MSASTSDLNTTTSQSEQNAGVYLLNNAFSTSPPTATTLMQQLQQSVPSTCHSNSILMQQFLLKHATAALAAQHIEPMNSFQQSQMEDFPIETPQLSSIKIEDDQKSKTTNICAVCLDEASGKHYGSVTCFGCKGFFRRTVRSNKVYTCRYDQSCQIDKVGRNVCRSCRFRKCLLVGMVPDAIRPDRDKTGRQRNPRRSVNSMSSSKSHGDVDMDDRTSRASPSLDAQCASTASSPSDNDFNLQSCCESNAPSAAAVQQKDLIMSTLSQIERICVEFIDDPKLSPSNCVESEERLQMLTDVIVRTSLIARRTLLDYSGRLPLKDPNCYANALRRLVVQAIDYANTLKPIADMDKNEKIVLIRSFIASFILLTTVHKSVNEGQTARILLPNGYYVDATTPLSAFREEPENQAKSREQTWIESRINFTRSNIIEKLNTTVDKLNLTDEEFICLKAILVLDPNVAQLSEQSAQKLNLARDHVQNALYVHLTEQYGDQEAITRFGNLLMLLGNITKTGVHFGNIIQMSRELQPNADSMILELFSI